MNGHGIIINLSSGIPLVFQYNPTDIQAAKKINYFIAPNIGGASRKKYFTGFDNKEVRFSLVLIDKENPVGVSQEIAYFSQLSEPDPGLLGIAGSFFGNENYPPPQVLFQWGVSMVPLRWDVDEVKIKETHFNHRSVSGVIGIPWRAEVDLSLSLDEDSALFKMNQISAKVNAVAGSINSILKEGLYKQGRRKDKPGIYPSIPA